MRKNFDRRVVAPAGPRRLEDLPGLFETAMAPALRMWFGWRPGRRHRRGLFHASSCRGVTFLRRLAPLIVSVSCGVQFRVVVWAVGLSVRSEPTCPQPRASGWDRS